MKHYFILSVLLPLSFSNAFASILPKNDLYLQDDIHQFASITQAEFNKIINDIVAVYKPIVKNRHGAKLTSNNMWNDSTVNASAEQVTPTDWQINMYGGLARRSEITRDAFAMVVCHELGHHLGGFSFYRALNWAANEGQADYFAAQSCARKIWQSQKVENALARENVDTFVKEKCDSKWTTPNDQNICYRIALAGDSLALLFAATAQGETPHFETPDVTQVASTRDEHPKAQCRLDTYFAGALCDAKFNGDLIPGKSFENIFSRDAELEASDYSCTTAGGFKSAVRPRCWFKPQLEWLGIRVANSNWKTAQAQNVERVLPGQNIKLSLALINRSPLLASNVSTIVNSISSNARVMIAKQYFENFNSLETHYGRSDFEFFVNQNAKCGEEVKVALISKSSINNSNLILNSNLSVPIGLIENTSVGSVSPHIAIPDKNEDGVNSVIRSQVKNNVLEANLTVEIEHVIPSDVKAVLKSPNGSRYPVIFERLRPGRQTVQVSFPVKELTAVGDWVLNIADIAQKDVGIFHSWKLDFKIGVCK